MPGKDKKTWKIQEVKKQGKYQVWPQAFRALYIPTGHERKVCMPSYCKERAT